MASLSKNRQTRSADADDNGQPVYHCPSLYRFVSYVTPDTNIIGGSKLQSFKYTSDDKIQRVDNISSDFLPYRSRSHCRTRKVVLLHLPDPCDGIGIGSRAIMQHFGHKNTYKVIASDLETGQEYRLAASKKQQLLVWKGGFERINTLRKGAVLVMRGGARAVVESCEYNGYVPVYRVLLRDSQSYFANDFVCCNTFVYKKTKPAVSYGIIGYRGADDADPDNDAVQFLVIRRKHTMGFMDLIRARFYNRSIDEIVRVYLSEMTRDERYKIATYTFDELWDEIWVNHKSKSYRNEYTKAKLKYTSLPLARLSLEVSCEYEVPEYGFPKGRKNRREDCVGCAKREFEEETGLAKCHYTLIKSAPVFGERFIATNGMEYRHLYYLAKISNSAPAPSTTAHVKQLEEIGAVEWRTPAECKDVFRPYDTSKKQVVDEVHAYLSRSKK